MSERRAYVCYDKAHEKDRYVPRQFMLPGEPAPKCSLNHSTKTMVRQPNKPYRGVST